MSAAWAYQLLLGEEHEFVKEDLRGQFNEYGKTCRLVLKAIELMPAPGAGGLPTRKELLKLFMEEGGISTRAQRRYVYRRCGYIKVDVEFAPSSDQNNHEQRPDDRITDISKPFLERPILD
ncbi:MAG: hypothetical protein ACLP9L_33730 [Thermoguttaceae bacterium]